MFVSCVAGASYDWSHSTLVIVCHCTLFLCKFAQTKHTLKMQAVKCGGKYLTFRISGDFEEIAKVCFMS